jgi:protein-tyrosine phosphatase
MTAPPFSDKIQMSFHGGMMIDVHSHILHGIDDGANDEAASLEMARSYQELGFEKVVASPHITGKVETALTAAQIESRVRTLNDRIRQSGIKLEVVAGAEYYLERDFLDIADSVWPLSRINNSMFVLVEMPALFMPANLGISFFNNKVKNPELKKLLPFLQLIIAHPERNEGVIKDPERAAARIKEQGVYIQMNLGSLTGYYGKTVKKAAEQILKLGLVDLVGTDSHAPEQVRTMVPEGLLRLRKLAGDEAVKLLMQDNPEKVLAGETPEPFY